MFPYVAAASVLKIFVYCFTDVYLEAVEATTEATSRLESFGDLVSEIHAVVSAAKPLITWTCMNAIQESREACGGHGFLKAARLGDLRNISDPSVTYEGDNNVLSQQTSNWLLRQLSTLIEKGTLSSPLGTCSFLANKNNILKKIFNKKTVEEIMSIDCKFY